VPAEADKKEKEEAPPAAEASAPLARAGVGPAGFASPRPYTIARVGRPLILHYHVVADVPAALDPDKLSIAPDRLGKQLQFIQRHGYRFVPLADVVQGLCDGRDSRGLCALTFDDGTQDNLTVLPDILRQLGAPATVYVCPGLAGKLHPSFDPRASIRLMEEDELVALAAVDGVEIGSHTLRHTCLDEASAEQAYEEMSASKQALERLLGRRVSSFAYPGCGYSPVCPDAARRAGYASAVTCGRRGSWDPYELRRASPNRLDNAVSLWLKSRHLYDPVWASAPGRLLRAAARPIRHGGSRA
jgi:peptidoglycan/xylan/chitin deacetylase (PgdA/CDA1 family)